MYDAMVTDGLPGLREQVEGLLSDSPEAIAARIEELDGLAREHDVYSLGWHVNFGSEIEFMFRDPREPDQVFRQLTKEELYEQVVLEMQPSLWPRYDKGAIVPLGTVVSPVMTNDLRLGSYAPEHGATEVSEIRTSPDYAAEAIDRYWRTIQAIGAVAARHGLEGLILATHINTTVTQTTGRGSRMVDFAGPIGGKLLAAIQHNLNALFRLQIDAGLEEDILQMEAYPSKDGSTAVHLFRLEFRHPLVSVVDPRVDILATLHGVNQIKDDAVPVAAMRKLHECNDVHVEGLDQAIIVRDRNDNLPRLPAVFADSYRPHFVGNMQYFIEAVTGKPDADVFGEDEATLRRLVASLRLNDNGQVGITKGAANRDKLLSFFAGSYWFEGDKKYRVEPFVVSDSPAEHLKQRGGLRSSATVRNILGKAITALTPVKESVLRRTTLLKERFASN